MWKVMLADDEPYIREGLEKLIPWTELGCELVFQARNGRELLEKMEMERPDIVIVDIRMPVLDGLELAALISDRGWPIKIIILTAYADFEYARRALRCGASDYVMKTSALDEIPRVLGRITKELRESGPAAYRMLLLCGIAERGGALSKILFSCFEQENYTGAAAGERDYTVILRGSLQSMEELSLRCRKLLEMLRNFLGQEPVLCVGPLYYDEREAAEVYGHIREFLLSHEAAQGDGLLFMQAAEENPPQETAWKPEEGLAGNPEGCLPANRKQPENGADGVEENPEDLVAKTQRLIEKQFGSRITLVELAREVHANPSYLSRVYKQRTGENLFDAINRLRIERAKEYIAEQNRKIYEIAELVGFEDTAYFSRVFKKLAGISPSEFDRQCRRQEEERL